MAKNIVVCCDGTGNKFGTENSNVVKLYTCLKVEKDQRAYYHPGVGTMGDPRKGSWLAKQYSRIAGLAFGLGFQGNLADAYQFLMDTYEDGDHIYLFGFSRGAYTVRALAGVLFMYGLLCPGNEGHLPYLLDMFSQASRDAYNRNRNNAQGMKSVEEDDLSRGFRETFSRPVTLHFIGVWDTVSSVGWIYDPVKLLFDGQNPIVRKGRHAISVDERRCFFQNNLWGQALPASKTPLLRKHYTTPTDWRQDIVQAWFAGVHSDVGGSYPQTESAPAMQALSWILHEAEKDGLCLNEAKRDAVFGRPAPEFENIWKANLPAAPAYRLHNSLTWKWWPLELFPHKYFDLNGKKSWRFIPWPHLRELPDEALIHPSLRERLATDAEYKPQNLNVNDIRDYSATSVPLPHPEVMKQLAMDGFGVYRKNPAGKASAERKGLPATVAALL